MLHRLFYVALGGAAVLVVKAVKGDRGVVKGVYKGIARVNRGFERAAAEIREDLEDARREVEREEATRPPV